MHKFKIFLIGLFAIMFSVINAEAQIVVKVKPLRPRVVIVKPVHHPHGKVWIDGHWRWERRHHKYIWISGHWTKKHHGKKWVPGHWSHVRGGHKWVPGHWKRV
ncbi:MAG: YXWGXW repeat-containing protein [Bacteroidetes bacterium]|nr:YXWGXW repeat-containing protein [Bacteroidota bacterium]